MIKTHELTHVALSVRDPEQSWRFYASVFGVREYFRDANTIQVLGPDLTTCLPSSDARTRRVCAAASFISVSG
jgi:catechol 2,3-dioxygenase-like lactoylglutathione lyase family enzyme